MVSGNGKWEVVSGEWEVGGATCKVFQLTTDHLPLTSDQQWVNYMNNWKRRSSRCTGQGCI